MEGSQKRDVIIIGGGIIGLMSAYYLTRKGVKVTVIDKGPSHQASSHANCGLISPSHILPLNNLSLIFKSLGMLFQKDAPFKIRPQADPAFVSWLIGFLSKAFPSSIYQSTVARMALLLSSAELYQALIADEKIDCGWSNKGILFVFKDKRGFDKYKSTNDYTKRFNVEAESLVGNDLLDKEPALKDNLYGAWYYDIDNWLKPDRMVKALVQKISEADGQIVHDTEINNFHFERSQLKGVSDSTGSYWEGDKFLLAAGAWSPLVSKKLGFSLPIIPGKGYSITMERPEICPSYPCIMMEKKVVATPWENSYRLGSTMELTGYDESLNEVRLEALKRGAEDYLRDPYNEDVSEKWWGWRPMTYDGLPIIDKSPKHTNLWLACGHSMVGMSMGTATGKLISETMLNEEPHLSLSPYRYKRFTYGF